MTRERTQPNPTQPNPTQPEASKSSHSDSYLFGEMQEAFVVDDVFAIFVFYS